MKRGRGDDKPADESFETRLINLIVKVGDKNVQNLSSHLDGLRVAPAMAPTKVTTPTLPKLKLPDTPTLPKVDVQLPKEGKEVALAAFALATGATASALKAAAAALNAMPGAEPAAAPARVMRPSFLLA